MARKCVCYATKEVGTTDTFYKDGKHYFKSKEIADDYKLQNSCRTQVIDLLANLVGYEKGQKFPSLLNKTLKELSDYYKWEVVLETLNKVQPQMEYAILTKSFSSEYGKFSYLMAILRNSIGDVSQSYQRKEKVEKVITNATVDDALISNGLDNIGTTQTKKDISKFLEDDIWN